MVTPEGGLPLVPMVLYAFTPSGVVDLPGTNRNCGKRVGKRQGDSDGSPATSLWSENQRAPHRKKTRGQHCYTHEIISR